jgi:flagellar secretion chaperone FliS
MNTTDPRKAYRQNAVQSASVADVFIQAYDELSIALHSAALAVEARDIEKKTQDLNHALALLIHMQGGIDFERGGEVAHTLNRFYTLIRKEIFKASCRLDAEGLRQAAAHVMEVRKIWEEAQAITLRNESTLGSPVRQTAPVGKPPAITTRDATAAEPPSPSGSWTA